MRTVGKRQGRKECSHVTRGYGEVTPVSRFHFHLRACGTIYRDLEGTDCSDLTEARAHALVVSQELMRRSEHGKRLWSIRVEDADGEPAFNLFFADVTGSRELLPPDVNEHLALTCRRYAELIDMVCIVRATVAESCILLARSRRKPQLVFSSASGRPKSFPEPVAMADVQRLEFMQLP